MHCEHPQFSSISESLILSAWHENYLLCLFAILRKADQFSASFLHFSFVHTQDTFSNELSQNFFNGYETDSRNLVKCNKTSNHQSTVGSPRRSVIRQPFSIAFRTRFQISATMMFQSLYHAPVAPLSWRAVFVTISCMMLYDVNINKSRAYGVGWQSNQVSLVLDVWNKVLPKLAQSFIFPGYIWLQATGKLFLQLWIKDISEPTCSMCIGITKSRCGCVMQVRFPTVQSRLWRLDPSWRDGHWHIS